MDTTVGTALQQRITYINNSISPDFSENRKYATYKHTVGKRLLGDSIDEVELQLPFHFLWAPMYLLVHVLL